MRDRSDGRLRVATGAARLAVVVLAVRAGRFEALTPGFVPRGFVVLPALLERERGGDFPGMSAR